MFFDEISEYFGTYPLPTLKIFEKNIYTPQSYARLIPFFNFTIACYEFKWIKEERFEPYIKTSSVSTYRKF